MIYNLENSNDIYLFDNQVKWLRENKKMCELKEVKKNRTLSQNSARWLYLEMVATILNNEGQTYNPPNTKLEVKFTKDNLYQIYWDSMRNYMFPNKDGQLSTKEFSELVEMVQMLFAKVFNISIQFPNYQDLILPNE